ncbi:MAG: CDP-diacylglycerol--glycerol-3-phosphate 3-phosphatidyltransferase [Gammaproteobacteria bacterium]
MNAPILLTWLRIALIPMFVLVFFLPFDWARPASSLIFVLAGLTDILDGYLARRLNQTSRFGAFLDPVADKLMVATALVLIVHSVPDRFGIPVAIAAAVIIGREITISALREWMAEGGNRSVVAVGPVGKIKTVAQIVALAWMLWEVPTWGIPIYWLGMAALFVAAVLTLISMAIYLKSAMPHFTTDID